MPYLDHAATTPLRTEALDAMLPFLREHWGNASSLHGPGRRARVAVDTARERVAGVLGMRAGRGRVHVRRHRGGQRGDSRDADWMRRCARPDGPDSSRAPRSTTPFSRPPRRSRPTATRSRFLPRAGAPRREPVAEALTDETGLVSVMLVNNEVGTVAPVAEIAAVAQRRGALCHTDAVQAAGLLDLNVDALGVDLLSISSHKVNGPKGAGALFVRAGTPFQALVAGGAQERRRRGGTENVAALVGFADGARARRGASATSTMRASARSRRASRPGSATRFGDALVFNTPCRLRRAPAVAPHILNVSFRPHRGAALDGQMLLVGLDMEGVHVSSGSACTSGALEPSHVLLAMDVPRETAAATVRYSLGRDTTEADIDAAIEATRRVVGRMRASV